MRPDEMEFWIDLNLPPQMAVWLSENFRVNAKTFLELDLTEVSDIDVYKKAAQKKNTIVITTKDVDFINYQNMVGAPPKILYLNIGNISNSNLKILILDKFGRALEMFTHTNESFIEIST